MDVKRQIGIETLEQIGTEEGFNQKQEKIKLFQVVATGIQTWFVKNLMDEQTYTAIRIRRDEKIDAYIQKENNAFILLEHPNIITCLEA